MPSFLKGYPRARGRGSGPLARRESVGRYAQGFIAAAFLPAMRPKTMHSVRLPPP